MFSLSSTLERLFSKSETKLKAKSVGAQIEVEYTVDESFDIGLWAPVPFDPPRFDIIEKKDDRLRFVKTGFSSCQEAVNWLTENVEKPYKLLIHYTRDGSEPISIYIH